MKFKSINTVKLILFIDLSLLNLGSVSYGALRSVKSSPQRNENTVNKTFVDPIENDDSLGNKIVNFEMRLLGTPYVAAGCSKNGFDCSRFVYYVYNNFKIKVPRS